MKKYLFAILSICAGLLIVLVILMSLELSLIKSPQGPNEVIPYTACKYIHAGPKCNANNPLIYWRFLGLAITNIFKPQALTPVPLAKIEKIRPQLLEQLKIRKNKQLKVTPFWRKEKSIDYVYDGYGRRISLASHTNKHKNFIAVFGDSWVHGDGLAIEDTLPYILAHETSEQTQFYNYGVQGGALPEALMLLYNSQLRPSIKEKNGLFIYVSNFMQYLRLRPDLSNSAYNMDKPYLTLNNENNLQLIGSYYEAHPVLVPLYIFLSYSAIGRLLKFYQKSWQREDLLPLQCQMLVAAKERIKEIFPQSQLIVVSYKVDYDPIKSCTYQNHINYFSPIYNSDAEESYLPDGHPSGRMHQQVVQAILLNIKSLMKD